MEQTHTERRDGKTMEKKKLNGFNALYSLTIRLKEMQKELPSQLLSIRIMVKFWKNHNLEISLADAVHHLKGKHFKPATAVRL